MGTKRLAELLEKHTEVVNTYMYTQDAKARAAAYIELGVIEAELDAIAETYPEVRYQVPGFTPCCEKCASELEWRQICNSTEDLFLDKQPCTRC